MSPLDNNTAVIAYILPCQWFQRIIPLDVVTDSRTYLECKEVEVKPSYPQHHLSTLLSAAFWRHFLTYSQQDQAVEDHVQASIFSSTCRSAGSVVGCHRLYLCQERPVCLTILFGR